MLNLSFVGWEVTMQLPGMGARGGVTPYSTWWKMSDLVCYSKVSCVRYVTGSYEMQYKWAVGNDSVRSVIGIFSSEFLAIAGNITLVPYNQTGLTRTASCLSEYHQWWSMWCPVTEAGVRDSYEDRASDRAEWLDYRCFHFYILHLNLNILVSTVYYILMHEF